MDEWLEKIKKRNILQEKKISREAGLVDKDNIIKFKRVYEEKLRQYQSLNVFNCDETGFFEDKIIAQHLR